MALKLVYRSGIPLLSGILLASGQPHTTDPSEELLVPENRFNAPTWLQPL